MTKLWLLASVIINSLGSFHVTPVHGWWQRTSNGTVIFRQQLVFWVSVAVPWFPCCFYSFCILNELIFSWGYPTQLTGHSNPDSNSIAIALLRNLLLNSADHLKWVRNIINLFIPVFRVWLTAKVTKMYVVSVKYDCTNIHIFSV